MTLKYNAHNVISLITKKTELAQLHSFKYEENEETKKMERLAKNWKVLD